MQKNLFLLNLGLRDDRFNQLCTQNHTTPFSATIRTRFIFSYIAWWAFDEVQPGWRRRGKQSGGSYTHFMLTEEQPHQCCGRTSRAITNQKGRRLFADDDRLFTATAAATTTFRSSRLCVMHFAAIPQSCIFAQSVVKIQLIMRLDGWLPGYLSTAPVFVRSLPPCVVVCVLLLVMVMMMIFILRGKCDCYLHVFFPFMILSRCPSMFNIPWN